MKKRITAILLCAALIIPAYAVLSEKDLANTLSVLRYELSSTYRDSERMSQKQDYTFDMTYALNEHNIEIPFPQRDVYLKSVPEGKQ